MNNEKEPIKLTNLSFCAGCAAKLRAEMLVDVINPFGSMFNQKNFPNLLIGLEEADDAAVYKLSDELALVFTTDFFPPIFDDPYTYGAIAAANSISDIYAMGGKPLIALNIADMPTDLPPEVISEIFRGGAEKAAEAGIPIAGGHTVRDKEPKYGLAVVGTINPNHIIRKSALKPGDIMVYTKPVGFGLIATSAKAGLVEEKDLSVVIKWMETLNQKASELALDFDVISGTDVTGFSLLGHSCEMIQYGKSGIGITYHYDKIPFVPNYEKFMEMELFPAGAVENQKFYQKYTHFSEKISEDQQMMLFDPQTSGGLLLGVNPQKIDTFMEKAAQIDQPAWIIGEASEGNHIEIL